VVPWSEVKNPQERKKETNTEAHACPNRGRDYFEIRDTSIYAFFMNPYLSLHQKRPRHQ
jgi:hypothetical protein